VALDALGVEIAIRRRELAALERAYDTIERGIDGADSCDQHATGGCAGERFAALCFGCGFVARRCTIHGASRAATTALRHHQVQQHGDHHQRATTEDAGRLRVGPEALPVGGLQGAPADRGDGGGDHDPEHPEP
jgi:hypothetical protein